MVLTYMRTRRAVPKVGDLAQVLGQVVLVVGLVGQLQVTTKRVQPDWISPAALNPTGRIKSNKSSLLSSQITHFSFSAAATL